MYWVGTVTAGMTAFYVFRAMFLTFFGEYRGEHHPHESPPVDADPAGRSWRCSRLAAASSSRFPSFSALVFPALETPEDIGLMAISVPAGVTGHSAWPG